MQSCTGLWGTAALVEQCEHTKEPAILLLVAVRLGMTEGKGILQILIKFIIKTAAEHH